MSCSWRFPRAQLRDLCEKRGRFTAEDLDFQEKIAFRTGLGDDTAVVPAIQAGRDEALGMEPARFEFAATCFPTIQELLDKTGVRADQISFVITNSSLFNPTPSLSAMIVNHFKMGKRTIGYSLGGMGCSAGIIALDLARELLELHPNSYALVVSHENITNNFYVGEWRERTDSDMVVWHVRVGRPMPPAQTRPMQLSCKLLTQQQLPQLHQEQQALSLTSWRGGSALSALEVSTWAKWLWVTLF
jgi:hypothetical protein